MNLGLTDLENFKSDSHGIGNGGPGVRGPPEVQNGSMKNIMIQHLLTFSDNRKTMDIFKHVLKLSATRIAIYFNLVKLL